MEQSASYNAYLEISIHALLAESDCFFCVKLLLQLTFLSTLSLRRATVHYDNYNLHCVISIHALLAESDSPCCGRLQIVHYFYPRSPCGERPFLSILFLQFLNFYPRSPCGERPWQRGSRVTYIEFLSTLSLRRATFGPKTKHKSNRISIHALLAESDSMMPSMAAILILFLSTLSLRRATLPLALLICQLPDFYPRSPCGERL